MPYSRVLVAIGLLTLGWAAPASAQLGTERNPPAQNLFDFSHTEKRLDTGLGADAVTRPSATAARQAARHVRRRRPANN